MIYTVTTKDRYPSQGDSSAPFGPIRSHWAVATLEEAQAAIRALVNNCASWAASERVEAFKEAMAALEPNLVPEQGGTVGPLPDGTVIEVKRASWDDLVGPNGWNTYSTDAEVAAAYNARKEVVPNATK